MSTSGRGVEGQRVVPKLPVGTRFARVDALGSTSWFIDTIGRAYATPNVANPFEAPAGLSYVQASGSAEHYVLLRSDGQLELPPGVTVPSLPGGVTYTGFSADVNRVAALRSDGRAVLFTAIADNRNDPGEIFPAYQAQVTARNDVTSTAIGERYALLLHADGTVDGVDLTNCSLYDGDCPRNPDGLKVPVLPKGMRYTAIDADNNLSVFVRSDGKVLTSGHPVDAKPIQIPTVPAGVRYTAASAGSNHLALLRSDGRAVLAGNDPSKSGVLTLPQIPKGVVYTDADAGGAHTLFLSRPIAAGETVRSTITTVSGDRNVRRGTRVTLRVKVFSMADTKTGTVRVQYKGRTIATGTVRSGYVANAAISTSRLPKGAKSTLMLKYLGHDQAGPSYSSSITIRTT